jgi:hypothetical protein
VKTAKESWQLWWEWRVGSPVVTCAVFKRQGARPFSCQKLEGKQAVEERPVALERLA